MGKIMRELIKKHEALKLAREVEKAKQDSTKEISIEKATTIVAQQYKKAQSLTDQDKGKEHPKTFNDIIPLGTDIDNGDIYNLETGQTIKEL